MQRRRAVPEGYLPGLSNLNAGYVKVRVVSGSGIVAYASVVDNRTNDATTFPMKRE